MGEPKLTGKSGGAATVCFLAGYGSAAILMVNYAPPEHPFNPRLQPPLFRTSQPSAGGSPDLLDEVPF